MRNSGDHIGRTDQKALAPLLGAVVTTSRRSASSLLRSAPFDAGAEIGIVLACVPTIRSERLLDLLAKLDQHGTDRAGLDRPARLLAQRPPGTSEKGRIRTS